MNPSRICRCSIKVLAGRSAATTWLRNNTASTASAVSRLAVMQPWRSFHASSSCRMKGRRRSPHSQRRLAGENQPDEDSVMDQPDEGGQFASSAPASVRAFRHQAVTDPAAFRKAAQSLLDRLEKAVKPMQPFNDPFLITRGFEEEMGDFLLIELGPLLGQYTIQVDYEQCFVIMRTPISGQRAYILSEQTGEWLDDDDMHVMVGLFARDLMRQCQGVPDL